MSKFTIAAVGDILIDRREPQSALAPIKRVLQAADLTFGNFEGALSDNHEPLPGAGIATIVPERNAEGLRGLDIVSLANNHVLDAGYGGLHDTMSAIRQVGCRTIGAGRNDAEAWQATLVPADNGTLAVVALATVVPKGWNATPARGGVATVRSNDYYGPRHPADYCPGVPPRLISVLNEDDWQRVENHIADLRQRVGRVVVSMHWGDYSRPYVITAFERDLAGRLSRLGVDLVLGHHHHCLRGVEFFGQMPVLYGLGNIVFDHPRYGEELRQQGADWLGSSRVQLESRFGKFGIFPRKNNFPFNDLARWTTVAAVHFGAGDSPKVEFVPARIDDEGTPHLIGRGSPDWELWLRFMERCIDEGTPGCRIFDAGSSLAGIPTVNVEPILLPTNAGF